jgi:uncharacterized membrane protein YhaH (DUF805 family)
MSIESKNDLHGAISEKISFFKAISNYNKGVLNFKGTATRTEYAVGVSYQWLMSIAFVFSVEALIVQMGETPTDLQILGFKIFQWVWWIIAFSPSFALTFRRSRDAVNGVKLAVINYISLILSLVAYISVFALYSFPPEYIAYFWVSLAFTIVSLLVALGSFFMLLLKKNK